MRQEGYGKKAKSIGKKSVFTSNTTRRKKKECTVLLYKTLVKNVTQYAVHWKSKTMLVIIAIERRKYERKISSRIIAP